MMSLRCVWISCYTVAKHVMKPGDQLLVGKSTFVTNLSDQSIGVKRTSSLTVHAARGSRASCMWVVAQDISFGKASLVCIWSRIMDAPRASGIISSCGLTNGELKGKCENPAKRGRLAVKERSPRDFALSQAELLASRPTPGAVNNGHAGNQNAVLTTDIFSRDFTGRYPLMTFRLITSRSIMRC